MRSSWSHKNPQSDKCVVIGEAKESMLLQIIQIC